MSLIDDLITWYSVHMNYASITGLMAVESSFIPFPSEVVIPPAAFVAGQPESVLCATGNYPVDVLLIVLFGTLGAMIGAIINYVLSVWLGRLIIYKFADSRLGHMCLLSSEKLERAEAYFREKGNVSTFVGRFIPGIRQLISIPAGLSRMHFGAFLWWTFLGAFIWNCILALLGYVAAGQMSLIKEYSHELSVAILGLLGVVVVYFIVKRLIASTKR
ncbi:MAG: DedA family protein [Paludibacteraceae bacterium]|jgi:membrane protein DedA with SNARE-associated domain|nr:DedA family protein [Paludibacteraceae bacterium]MBR6115883.1 DedA family protein [Paludibacteraceae bacterium]